MLPYDPRSLLIAAGAAALLLAACWRFERRARVAAALVVLAGGMLRLDSGWQRSLHEWDERFHAVVAKNLIEDPLTPALYRQPAIDYDYRDWTRNHVWLHKPPLALWAMAGSMSVFGVGELAMRLPSLLLSTGAIALTLLIGRSLFGVRVALLAAAFHALNGFLVALASGRRVADHVDTALIFLFELTILFALKAGGSWTAVGLCGCAVGLGVLAKSLPALLAIPVVFVSIALAASWQRALARTAAVAVVGLAVAAPWTIYSWRAFPAEAAWESQYTLMHVTQSLESADGGVFSYLRDLPRFFGELTPVSLALAAWWGIAARPPRQLAVPGVWIAVPYVLFSIAATRMPAFIMVSAPAIFLVHAWVWWRLRERLPSRRGAGRATVLALLAVMAVAPARYLLEPTGVLERRDRRPAPFDELRTLEERLGGGDAVIFNMPLAVEAMFYSPYTAYEQLPTEQQVRRIATSGRRVVIYQPAGQSTALPRDWPVTYLEEQIPKP